MPLAVVVNDHTLDSELDVRDQYDALLEER